MKTPYPSPGPEDRLAATRRPEGPPAMRQRWEELLFLHWEVPAAQIEATLPEGLSVDLYEGHAYVGLVPFLMRGVRPRGLPPVPGISDFLEMNVRTYVHDRRGRPGVWFYSLDASQGLAVALARRFFHLPYYRAAMGRVRDEAGAVSYRSRRRGTPLAETSLVSYRIGPELPPPQPGSFEWFLVERYLLYAYDRRRSRLYSGRVHHAPYPLTEVELRLLEPAAMAQAGFPAEGPPVHAAHSPGVSVEVFALEEA